MLNKNDLTKYFNLVIGSALLSIGIWLFVTPCNINFGGVVGVAQLINYFLIKFFGVGSILGIINLCLNIPLFLIALKIMQKEFCFKTILSLIIQTFLLSVLPALNTPLVEDMLLNTIFGAAICGVGVGLALRSSGCCGGIDIACMCLVKKNPDFKAGRISIYFNIVLFGSCFFIQDVETILYSIVFVALLYTIADHFHSQNINVMVLIFTKNPDMKKTIMEETHRGVTYWDGKGAYTEENQEILCVMINKYELQQMNEIIKRIDPNAFVTFSSGTMVHGGFEKRL